MSTPKLSPGRLARFHDVLAGHVELGEATGLVALLSIDDEPHIEAIGAQELDGAAPMRPDSLFRIASMTKPVTAVAALMLIEECVLRLDDAVVAWLPELANRRVLREMRGKLDDTEPAARDITVRDLLTFTNGFGAASELFNGSPIGAATIAAGIVIGPAPLAFGHDEYMAKMGALPLMCQPGQRWIYHCGSDLLGVLISRASGMSLGEFFRQRIFAPLGMEDTGFSVPPSKIDRLVSCYYPDGETGKLNPYDPELAALWNTPPQFESGGGGLVSSAGDYYKFARMLMNGGRHGATRLLARPTIELMTADHITPEQKAASNYFPGFWDRTGWGLGVSVTTHRGDLAWYPGAYGWDGGLGTSWRNDPHENLTGILLTQTGMNGPRPANLYRDFWTSAYAAIDC